MQSYPQRNTSLTQTFQVFPPLHDRHFDGFLNEAFQNEIIPNEVFVLSPKGR
jgi:hypothetical protein